MDYYSDFVGETITTIKTRRLSFEAKLELAEALGFVITYDEHNQIVLQTGIYQDKNGNLGTRKVT